MLYHEKHNTKFPLNSYFSAWITMKGSLTQSSAKNSFTLIEFNAKYSKYRIVLCCSELSIIIYIQIFDFIFIYIYDDLCCIWGLADESVSKMFVNICDEGFVGDTTKVCQ